MTLKSNTNTAESCYWASLFTATEATEQDSCVLVVGGCSGTWLSVPLPCTTLIRNLGIATFATNTAEDSPRVLTADGQVNARILMRVDARLSGLSLY